MKYLFPLLFSIVLSIMAIIDFILKSYNFLSMIVIIIAALNIFIARKAIINLENERDSQLAQEKEVQK